MLRYIEIKNFESHKHTVIDGLSEAFNLIRGESNAGKTSIVRALKLAAYNQFDPKSLRVGESKCEVIVETDKGRVEVIRGPKVNTWKITPRGKPAEYFDKVGKNVVPQAAEIIGLNIVRLGDADIPVNIMDQLESHFMLKSVGGQDASGSLRAQVIDEISGLSGIEGVIKGVSLDNHRFGREVKITEDEMERTRAQMHDENALKQEEVILKEAGAVLADHDGYVKASDDARRLIDDWNGAVAKLGGVVEKLNKIPDLNKARKLLNISIKAAEDSEKAGKLLHDYNVTVQRANEASGRLAALPDLPGAAEMLSGVGDAIRAVEAAQALFGEYQRVKANIAAIEKRLRVIKKVEKSAVLVDDVAHSAWRSQTARELLDKAQEVQAAISSCDARLKTCNEGIAKAVKERDAILATVKVCPLTLEPVSKQCLSAAKKERVK